MEQSKPPQQQSKIPQQQSNAPQPILSATGLCKEYGTAAALVRAVDNVSLTVTRGESVAVVGPSGCGKSTLLYLLGGLERPTAGTLELAG